MRSDRLNKLIEIARENNEKIVCVNARCTAYCYEWKWTGSIGHLGSGQFLAEDARDFLLEHMLFRGWRELDGDVLEGARIMGAENVQWDVTIPKDIRDDPLPKLMEQCLARRAVLLAKVVPLLGRPAQEVDVLEALLALPRYAGACREMADTLKQQGKKDKAEFYLHFASSLSDARDRILFWLEVDDELEVDEELDDQLVVTGCFCLEDRWFKVLEGRGYCFHRECEKPDELLDQADSDCIKPESIGEDVVPLEDMLLTLRMFLSDLPMVELWDENICPHCGMWSNGEEYCA